MTKTKNKTQSTMKISNYLKKYWVAIFFYVLVYLVAGACSIFQTILLANAIELITLEIFKQAMLLMFGVVGLIVAKRFCWFMSGLIYNKYAIKMMSDMNLDVAKQAFKLNSKTYNDHDTGTFVQRIVSDPERIVNCLADIVDAVTDIITAVIMIIYISTLNPYVTLILIGIVAVGLTIEAFRIKFRRKNRKQVRKTHDMINSLTTEIVRSEKDIKSLGLEEKLSEVSKQRYQEYRKAMYKTEMTDMSLWSSRNLIIESVGILLLIFGVFLMDADPAMLTMGAFMVIYSNHNNLYHLIWGIGSIANNVVDIKVSSERMAALFDENEFVTERFGDVTLESIVGEIEFKNVSYSFKEFETKTDENENGKKKRKKKKQKPERVLTGENKIFNDLSFKIEPNKTVAFVGKSGSGKSTILNLMSKMYEAESGEVLIDGHNINSLSKETLRGSISLVNQFPYIFDMTIKENLTLAKKDATDEEIAVAIKDAYLTEFIDTLKKGIDTKVGESGIKLSGGQKQRLAIARALLRKPPIIIFDESTSSLDNFAQEEVKKSIDGLKGKSTIVIVAHRLSTIKNVDTIFFLDEGKIVQQGTFDELYDSNEKFRAMFLAENI